MTHSFGEQPKWLMDECSIEEPRNGVSVSRLSQILEALAHPRFYLSAKACIGIINRAEKRQKQLPEILKEALMEQIRRSDTEN